MFISIAITTFLVGYSIMLFIGMLTDTTGGGSGFTEASFCFGIISVLMYAAYLVWHTQFFIMYLF